MMTEAKIPDYPMVAESFKLLLGSIWEWLMDNPPWAIGIAVAVALLLWYFLHARPAKRREEWRKAQAAKNAERQALLEQQTKKTNDEKLATQQYFDKKRADARAAKELEDKQREDSAAMAAQKIQDQEAANQAIREKVGTDFELRIVNLINKDFVHWIETDRAKLLHNIVLPEAYNAQIDAILIDTSGIYVIECKCWDSMLLGKYDWYYWLAINMDFKNALPIIGKEKEPFYCKSIKSPVNQNEYHKKALNRFLNSQAGKDFIQFKRLTVFDSCGNIDFVLPPTQKSGDKQMQYTWVGKKDELCDAIKNYDTITPAVSRLAPGDVNLIYNKLKPYSKSI